MSFFRQNERANVFIYFLFVSVSKWNKKKKKRGENGGKTTDPDGGCGKDFSKFFHRPR